VNRLISSFSASISIQGGAELKQKSPSLRLCIYREEMIEMRPLHPIQHFVFMGVIFFLQAACGTLAVVPTATAAPAIETRLPLSQQVMLTFVSFREQGQLPTYTISAQTPMFAGVDDARVQGFNEAISNLVQHEIGYFRKNVLAQMPAYPVSSGSSFDAQYVVIFQGGGIWSLKFEFSGYADGAAHSYHYSRAYSYDLEQGKELSLEVLFPADSDYLDALSSYCIAELSRRDIGFYGGFQQGAEPTPANYRNWNITANGLLVTFDEYQVAPYAAGPQTITVPYSELTALINPKSPLALFSH
jgi:hypothetical protein